MRLLLLSLFQVVAVCGSMFAGTRVGGGTGYVGIAEEAVSKKFSFPGTSTSTYITTTSVNTIDIKAGGTTAVQITSSAANGPQILLPNPTISETPNIASISNPLSGFVISSGDSAWCYNRVQSFTFRYSGTDGNKHLMMNGFGKKDTDAYEPHIQNEQSGANKDGITWIDNRLPDGTNGHDANGRFVLIGVGGVNNLRVGSEGVAIGTTTVAGSTLTVHGVLKVSTGTLKVPVGSASTPVITSTSDATTGIYFPASNSMSVSPGGTESVRFYNSGTYRQTYFYPSGDGSKPTISFPTYTGTGIGNSTNDLHIYNNGSANFYFLAAGSFRGSWNSTTAGTPAIGNILDTNTGIFWPAADNLGFSTGGTENFRLTTSGTLKTTSANESTGAGSASLGSNCPATTASAPYTWIKMISSDGSTVYVPAWK